VQTSTTPLPWHDPQGFDATVELELDSLFAVEGRAWSIYWCAGSGVVGTAPDVLDAEVAQFAHFLDMLEARLAVRALRQSGSMFFASSAGGVYAGSANPPFSENSVPIAISHYGEAKIQAEARLRQFVASSGLPALIGRISNLYGAGQSLSKRQGIISQLCSSSLGGGPTSLYVSLDTIRDYISAEDCARLVMDCMSRLRETAGVGTLVTKILASHQPVTLGAILGMFRSIFKRRPNAMIGSSPNSALQVRDLRFRSLVWPDLDERHLTPLAVGIHSVATAMIVQGNTR
jgi:UDP-glucose 4-epimerase